MKHRILKSLAGLSSLLFLQALSADNGWLSLFDGKTLDGWTANEEPESWAIEEGAIVTQGKRSHLFYTGEVADHDFKNFIFEAEVMTSPGANSGVYVHTKFQDKGWPAAGYECQVINSNQNGPGPSTYVERKMTGSIYAVRNTWVSPVQDNVWFAYRISVVGKTIRTFVDGRLICEYTEPEAPWRPEDKKQRLLGSGTFALQAHDPGSVARFRNLRVKVLPEDLETPGEAEVDAELDRWLTVFANSNHALIDIGIEIPSLSYAEQQAALARRFGMSFVEANMKESPASLLVLNDRLQAPDLRLLRAAKASGCRVVFSSGGAAGIDPARLKARLQAIAAAELGWEELWVPGK